MATIEEFKVKFGKATIKKDPDDELEYTASFATWLTRCDDVIASVAVTYTGVTEVYAPTHDDTTVTIWVTGVGSARIRITTVGAGANPRQKDQTLYFKSQEH